MAGFPVHQYADGAGRLSRSRSAFRRHARHARHLRSQSRDAWLRRHVQHRRALRRPRDRAPERFSPGSIKIHADIDPSNINKNVAWISPSWATRPPHPARHDRCLARRRRSPRAGPRGAVRLVGAHRRDWRGAWTACASRRTLRRPPSSSRNMPCSRLYEICRDSGPRHVHQHRSRPAPDVGGTAFPLREAEPLDDQRRPRHHGLRPARRDGRADRAIPMRSSSTLQAKPAS